MVRNTRANTLIVAYQEFKKLGIDKFPLNMFDIYKNYNIPLVTYTEASKNLNFTVTVENLRAKHVDAFCFKSEKSYIVFYDDEAYSDRIPFTLAHELGHILLKHHYYHNNGIIKRYAVLKHKDWRETEADSFAGAFLRPAPLIKILNLHINSDIAGVFGISGACAKVGASIAKRISTPPKLIDYFKHQFYDFIYARYCTKCHHSFIISNCKYCPICGSEELIWDNKNLLFFSFLEYPLEGELPLNMHYHEYPTQPNGKTQKCIQCHNENIGDNDFCHICGLPTQNFCKKGFGGCGNTIPLNARYCPYCGTESIYYFRKVLPSWTDEHYSYKQESNSTQHASTIPVPLPPFLMVDNKK